MMLLNKLGIMEVDSYRDKRRIAYFVLAVVAALGPSIDVFSMMFQWIALCLLYEFGIWLCVWSPRTPGLDDDFDVPDSEEMVEV
jgi:Sec-independent protein secretion pathway component TatC